MNRSPLSRRIIASIGAALLALTFGANADPAPSGDALLQRLEKAAYADAGFRTEWEFRREMVNAPAQPRASLEEENKALEKRTLERLDKSADKALSPEAKSAIVKSQTAILETMNRLPPQYTTEGSVILLMESPSKWYLETKCTPMNRTEPITQKWIANGKGLVARVSAVANAKTGVVFADSVNISDEVTRLLKDGLPWLPGFWLASNQGSLRNPVLSGDRVLSIEFPPDNKLRAQFNPDTFQIVNMERFDATGRMVIMWGRQGADWSSRWALIPSQPDSFLATLKERRPLNKEDLQKLDYVIPANGLVGLQIHGTAVKVDRSELRGKHLSDIHIPSEKKN